MVTSGFERTSQSVVTILDSNPRAVTLSGSDVRFLEIDKRPDEDLRLQFTFCQEGTRSAIHDRQLGRISATGDLDLSFTPLRGWHVFHIMPNDILLSDQPDIGPTVDKKPLATGEKNELANWLSTNQADFVLL